MRLVKMFLLLLIFMVNSCRLSDVMNRNFQDIKIINSSNIDIAFYPYSFIPVSWKYGEFYPDTLLPPEDIGFYSVKISPMHSNTYTTRFETKNIRSRFGEKDSLMFYVFSVDTLDKYSWEEIRQDYKILKRYDLSISDLDSMNWTIIYP